MFRVADEDDPLTECIVELLVHKEALADQTQDSQVVGDVPHDRVSVNPEGMVAWNLPVRSEPLYSIYNFHQEFFRQVEKRRCFSSLSQ